MECIVSLNAICFVTINGTKNMKSKANIKGKYLKDNLYLLKIHTMHLN